MTPRDVVRLVLEGKKPPYVPWSCGFTQEAKARLQQHYGTEDIDTLLQNHLLKLGSDIGFFEDLGNDRVRDVFGVVWDRSVDKDIGIVEGCLLPEPTLAGFRFPDPLDRRFFVDIPAKIAARSGPLPGLPDRVLPVRAGLDPARHGEPADGLCGRACLRAGPVPCDRRLQHRPGPRGSEVRHRRRLLRRRLGPAARAANGAHSLATSYPARAPADVRRGPRRRASS